MINVFTFVARTFPIILLTKTPWKTLSGMVSWLYNHPNVLLNTWPMSSWMFPFSKKWANDLSAQKVSIWWVPPTMQSKPSLNLTRKAICLQIQGLQQWVEHRAICDRTMWTFNYVFSIGLVLLSHCDRMEQTTFLVIRNANRSNFKSSYSIIFWFLTKWGSPNALWSASPTIMEGNRSRCSTALSFTLHFLFYNHSNMTQIFSL